MTDEFVSYIVDLLTPIGGVTARRMFGAYGLYKDGRMFAIVDAGLLYLKTDSVNRHDYDTRLQPHFTYTRNGKPCRLAYREVPDEVLEEPETLGRWANEAYSAACRGGVDRQGRT